MRHCAAQHNEQQSRRSKVTANQRKRCHGWWNKYEGRVPAQADSPSAWQEGPTCQRRAETREGFMQKPRKKTWGRITGDGQPFCGQQSGQQDGKKGRSERGWQEKVSCTSSHKHTPQPSATRRLYTMYVTFRHPLMGSQSPDCIFTVLMWIWIPCSVMAVWPRLYPSVLAKFAFVRYDFSACQTPLA